MGEDEVQTAVATVDAPQEGLEARMTRAVEGTTTTAPEAPTLDGVPLETTAAAPEPDGGGWQSVRDYARAQGVELPYQDDAAALNDLIRARQQLQQRDYFSEVGQRFAPHASQLQEYLRTRQQQASQDAPQPWAAPKFDKTWLAMVERDENTGGLRAKPGYDPAIAEKVQAYADWRDKFLDNPEQVVAPLIEQRAQQLIEAKFAEHAQQSLADDLVRQNAGWMFAADATTGQPSYDRQGRRQLSPAGVVYARAAKDLWDSGVKDVRQVDAYARTAAENAALRGHLQQLRPAAREPSQAPAQQQSAASVGGGLGRPEPALPRIPPSQKGLSLREMLQQNLRGASDDISL